MSTLKIVLITLLIASAGCTTVLYQPSREVYFEPSKTLGIEPIDLYYASENGPRIHAWHFKAKTNETPRGLVVQFHGNAENITSHFQSLVWIVQRGYDLFTFDYRGYGKSEGAAYAKGVHIDAVETLSFVQDVALQRGIQKVILYGQSLGGAVMLRALSDRNDAEKFHAIVLEGSFPSFQSISRQKLSDVWFLWPFQWLGFVLVSDRYSPESVLKKIPSLPKLVIHSRDDPIIPISHGRKLYEKLTAPKCFWEIAERGHVNLMNVRQGAYRQPVLDFIENQTCPLRDPLLQKS